MNTGTTTRTGRWITMLLIAGSALGATACNEAHSEEEQPYQPAPEPLKMHDFAKLCSGGELPEPVAAIPKGKLKPLVLFEKGELGYTKQMASALDAWGTEDPEAVGLVACVEKKRLEVASKCNFDNGHTLTYYDMERDVRILDASTGKVLAREKFVIGGRGGCPAGWKFSSKHEWMGRPYENKVLSMALPFQPDDAPLPAIPTNKFALNQVCNGLPFPQIRAFDPAAKTWQGISYNERGPSTSSTFVGRLSDEAADMPLTACIRGKAEKKQRDCEFTGGRTLAMYDGEVEVEIRETRTAKVIAKKTFRTDGEASCPFSHDFGWDGATILGRVDKTFNAFVEQYTGKRPTD